MTTWTHEGKPLGQPQQPWRLTRAQRVEMEAALARLRGNVRTVPDAEGWYSSETVEVTRTLGAYTMDAVDDGVSESVFRARVAIALRAALRADEDARCEEALRRAGYGEETGATPGDAWDTGYDEGACSVIDVSREWPPVYHDHLGLVPLALWEVDERRRRETVRAVVALLTWGLS